MMARKNTHPGKGAKRGYRIELSPFSLFLWGFCALFFMAWIFVLGVLVGRGFLPGADNLITDLKNQAARLQEMVTKSKRGDQGFRTKETIDETLAFYEKLDSKKDEAKRKEQDPALPREGAKQGALEQAKGEPAGKDGAAGVKTAKPGREGSPTAPPPSKGVYTLQLASFEEKAKAESMVRDFISKGHDAYSYEVWVKGKTYYRVRCGRFMTREEAEAYAAKLHKSLNVRGFVSRFE
jgi:cell division septation protein DedD